MGEKSSTKSKDGVTRESTFTGTTYTPDEGKNLYHYNILPGVDAICETEFRKVDGKDYYEQSNVVRCHYKNQFENESTTPKTLPLRGNRDVFDRRLPNYKQW